MLMAFTLIADEISIFGVESKIELTNSWLEFVKILPHLRRLLRTHFGRFNHPSTSVKD